MQNFRNKAGSKMMAFVLSIAMLVSSVASSGMTVMASENPSQTGAAYAYEEADTTDMIGEDIEKAEEEAFERDGAAEIENKETVESSEAKSEPESSQTEDESKESGNSKVPNSEVESSEVQSSEIESSEEQSSAVQSSEEQSSQEQSSEEQSSEEQSSQEQSSESAQYTTGSGKVDVWDFGAKQETDTKTYENHITADDWDNYDGLGSDGKFKAVGSVTFGDLTLTHEPNDRLYSSTAKKTNGTPSGVAVFAYSDGYTAAGDYYCNGTGGSGRRHLTINNVSKGDRIDVYVGSNNTTATPFYFEYLGTDGTQKDSGEAGVVNGKLTFVARYTGQYKIWADAGGGKPIYNRAVRIPAANVAGTIDLGPLASGTPFTVKFVNETTKEETLAELNGTSFSAKLAAGYTYNAVLSGAVGYGFSNASKRVSVTTEDVVNGKAYIKLVVEEKTVYDYSGTIKGFASDYDLSKLKVIMMADPDTESDDVELNIEKDTLAFTAKLEPDVAYTITLEGVNDYKVKDGEEIIDKNAAYTADINVVLKDTYTVAGKFIDLEGNEVTGVTALKFTNDDDKYEYEATLAADKKSYTVKLRDGAYSAVPTIENYKTTEHVVVEGKDVEKDILFVSTVADGSLELKQDLYVGYTDKGDANYETVNKAVKAAKRMAPTKEEERITIHIAPGVYREQIIVDVPYVSFVNDTPEKEVKLTWYQGIGYQYYSCVSGYYSAQDAHDKYKKGEPKNWGAAVQIKSTGFLAENIVFEHSLNRYLTEEELEDGVEPTAAGGKPERNYNLDVNSKDATERGCAMFIDSGGTNAEFYRCQFLSSQDTVGTGKAGARAYFKECFIEGNTDYICYDGDTVFDNCVLNFKGYSDKGSGGYLTAAQDTATYGYLFRNCTITGSKEKGMIVDAGYLGRPWGAGAKVTFVNTKMESADLILAVGWTSMSSATPENANFKEYNTTLLDGTKVDTSKRTAGTVLTENPATDVSVYFGTWTPKHYVAEEETVAFVTKPFITDNGDINTPYPGHTLIVGYSLGEANDANDVSVIQWYRVTDKADATKDVLVKTSSAGVDKTYKITKEDIGSYIKAVVTPTTVSGNVGEPESCIVEEAVRDGYEDPDASGSDAELGDGINVFLIGDSTVKDYSAKGMTTGGNARDEGAWGEFLQSYFNKEKVTVVNYANGGRSSRSFINEGSLAKVVENLSEGDYVFIQFGHNDCSNGQDYLADRYVPLGTPDANGVFPTTPGTKVTTPTELSGKGYGDTCYTYDCGGTYKWYLKLYVDAAKEKGAIPVLVTPVSRMNYDSNGKIKPHHDSTDTTTGTYVSSNNAYVTAVKQLAEEENVLLIDGFELTKKLFEDAYASGGKNCGSQIMHTGDGTHNNKLGGMIEAALIATAIQNMDLSISYAVKAPTQVLGQTTSTPPKTVFSVDGNGKFTAYDILTEYAEKATYWEELGQNMFDAIGAKAAELKPVEKPVASPASGREIAIGQKITLTAEEDAQIRYTTDKSVPTKESTLYDAEKGIVVSGAMIAGNTVTIKAIAVIGDKQSAQAIFTYIVGEGGNAGDDDDDNNNDKIKVDETEDVILLSDTNKITVTAANVFAVNKKASYKISVTYKNKKGEMQELKENVHYNVRFVNGSDGMTPGLQKFVVEQVSDNNKTDLGTFKGTSAVQEYTLLDKNDKTLDKNNDISKAVRGLAFSSAVYTGDYIIPGISWKEGKEPDKKDGKDQYKVVYRNNVNAGKASVTILGLGDYYGSKTLTFTIKPAKLTDIQPTLSATGVTFGEMTKSGGVQATPNTEGVDAFTYKGNPITFSGFKMEKTYGDGDAAFTAKLKKSIDYTIDYKKNAQEGSATATIKGINNYTGAIKVTYAIKNIDVSDLTSATVVAERALQGSGVTEIKIGDVTLKAGVDFKPDNKPLREVTEIAAGESVSVPIKGLGSYKKAFAKDAAVSVTKIENGTFHIKEGVVVDSVKLSNAADLKKQLSVIKLLDVNGKTISDKSGVVDKIDNITTTGFTVTATAESGFETTSVKCHVATKLSNAAKQDKIAIVKEFDGVNTVTLEKSEIVARIGDKKGQNVGAVVGTSQIEIVSYKNNNKTGNATVTIQAKDNSPFYGTMNIKFKINPDRKTPEYSKDPEGSDTPGSSEETGTEESSKTDESAEPEPIPEPCENTHTIWLVGDSTVCSFDDNYYYPRYGYGTQIGNYLDSKCEVKNLALSGRSSKSFLGETNYTTLKSGIKEGDVLVIGFGHNDEKNESDRYTNPNGDYQKEGSFAKSLYDNYVKVAQDKGAQVILCTPIVRRSSSDTLSTSNCHITTDKTDEDGNNYPGGDYPEAIRKLGQDVNVPVVDLTAATKELYESIGAAETLYLHAWTNSKPTSADDTHLNIYGAKRVAYLFAKELKEKYASTVDIARHVTNLDTVPSKEADLVSKEGFKDPEFNPNLAQSTLWDDYGVFKGTVFGSAGGQSKINKDNFYLGEDTAKNMRIAAGLDTAVGKISAGEEGFAMYYYKVPAGKTFSFSAKATINSFDTDGQVGFGLMARDDMYIDYQDKSIQTDYVAAGSLGGGTNCFWRKSGAFTKGGSLTTETLAAGKTYDLSIVYNGDGYACTFGNETTQSGDLDFQLTQVDENNVYIGMFASRKADISFSNIQLTVDGQAVDLQLPQ